MGIIMRLTGENIYLRFIELSDAGDLLNLNMKNRDFFKQFLTTRNDDYYTLEGQESRISNTIKGRENDEMYSFGVFLKDSDKLIGSIALSEVLRGAIQGCFVGYYLGQEHNGKGYMTEAVKLITKYAFEELKLHRIEAGVMPHNMASMKVLEKAGYVKEGISRKNVKINGEWRDHQVLAIINEND
jgi:ribosomal-protein-alanine N-acetyltransferase